MLDLTSPPFLLHLKILLRRPPTTMNRARISTCAAEFRLLAQNRIIPKNASVFSATCLAHVILTEGVIWSRMESTDANLSSALGTIAFLS